MIESNEQSVLIALSLMIYLFVTLLIALAGSRRSCGATRAFLISLFLTPLTGLFYVSKSPDKSILKTVHYRCRHCGLEYTSSHRYCHLCAKEGNKYRLHKISMKTY